MSHRFLMESRKLNFKSGKKYKDPNENSTEQ